jgi:anthranilate phosphoribosyltransferase
LTPAIWDHLAGSNPLVNAQSTVDVLAGRGTPQQSEIVALNAAVVLHTIGVESDLSIAFARCCELLRSGAGERKLVELRRALQLIPPATA